MIVSCLSVGAIAAPEHTCLVAQVGQAMLCRYVAVCCLIHAACTALLQFACTAGQFKVPILSRQESLLDSSRYQIYLQLTACSLLLPLLLLLLGQDDGDEELLEDDEDEDIDYEVRLQLQTRCIKDSSMMLGIAVSCGKESTDHVLVEDDGDEEKDNEVR
jgi:hypothetical protein